MKKTILLFTILSSIACTYAHVSVSIAQQIPDYVRLYGKKQMTVEQMVDHPLGFLSNYPTSLTYDKALKEINNLGLTITSCEDNSYISFSPPLDECEYNMKWNNNLPFSLMIMWFKDIISYSYEFYIDKDWHENDLDKMRRVNLAKEMVNNLHNSKGIIFADDPSEYHPKDCYYFMKGKYGEKDIIVCLSAGTTENVCLKLEIHNSYKLNTNPVIAPSDNSQNNVATVNTHNKTVNNAVSHTQESSARTWREDLVGGFVIVTQYPNGSQQRVRYRQCPNCRGSQTCGICHGTRACGICGGRGGIVSAGYGTFIPCVSCMSTGQCQICKGTGQCMCTTLSQYPGYVIGSSAFIGADGSVDKSTADYNHSSSSTTSTTPSRSTSGNCVKCGGTGVDPQPNSGGGLPEWVKYYNQEGTKCPYCGEFIAHFHNRCPSCNVPTR